MTGPAFPDPTATDSSNAAAPASSNPTHSSVCSPAESVTDPNRLSNPCRVSSTITSAPSIRTRLPSSLPVAKVNAPAVFTWIVPVTRSA